MGTVRTEHGLRTDCPHRPVTVHLQNEDDIAAQEIFFIRTSPILVVGEVPFLTLIGKTWKAHPWVEIGGKRISRNLTKTYTK